MGDGTTTATAAWRTPAGWFHRPLRWANLTLVQNDPGRYDPDFWLDLLHRARCDAASWNAGGIIAFYPTTLPHHRRNEAMGDSDPFGYLVEGCRKLGLYVTARVDHHATWPEVGEARPDWLLRDPAGRSRRHWYFTDWYAVYQTRDAGATWTLTIDGIEATVIHCLEQDPLRPGLIHLGMADNGYFRSTDGGTTWRRPETQPGNNTRCLAVCQSQPDVLYATGPATHGWRANQVYVSRDAGATWTRCGTAGLPELANRNTNTVAVDPRDPTRVWLTVDGAVEPGGGGPYVSRDGGATWTWAGAGLEGRNWFYQGSIWDKGRQLDIDPAGRLLTLSPRHNDRVFARDEATGQWLERPTPGRGVLSLAADPLRPGRWFLSGPGGVRVSLDGGETWRQTYQGETGVLVVDRRAPDLVAAGRPDGLIVSRDGGATWQPADPALPYRRNPVPGLAGERLLAATAGSGVFYLDLPR